MVVHADEEQDVGPVPVRVVADVVRPREAVVVDRPLPVVVVPREDEEAVPVPRVPHRLVVGVGVAQVGVVGDVLAHAVRVVGRGAVAVVVVRLPVLGPDAHGHARLAGRLPVVVRDA